MNASSSSSKPKKKGLIVIFAPLIALFIVLFMRVGLSLITVYLGQGVDTVVINIFAAILNFIALLSVIAFIVCIPIGITLILKKQSSNAAYDKRSGKGSQSVVPDEIRGWSWGAAGLGIIWGIYFNVWISLIALIPFVNFFWWIVMGIKGREWAWKNNKWSSIEEFNKSQKKWNIVGLILFILGVLSFGGSLANLGNSQNSASNNNSNQEVAAPKVFTSSDGLVTVSSNTDWSETTGLNNDASLQLKNKSGVYAILINEKKSDFALDLQGYANLVINNFKSSKTAAQLINGPLQTTINGNNAIQYEYTFTYNGINYVIQFTIVESQSHFHQIEMYGANSYFEANLPVFNLLLQGFNFQ
jgi:hypothetical protein